MLMSSASQSKPLNNAWKGIVTYTEKTPGGFYLRLNTKIWVYCRSQNSDLPRLGDFVKCEGTQRSNGKRTVIITNNIDYIKLFDIQKEIERFNESYPALCGNKVTPVYIKVFRKSLFNKFIKWSPAKQARYSLHPVDFYLNGHLDYYTATAIARCAGVPGEELIAADIRHILEKALTDKKESLRFDEVVETLKNRHPEVTSVQVTNLLKKAKVSYDSGRLWLDKVYYARKNCLNILQNKQERIINPEWESLLDEPLKELVKWRYSCLTGKAGTGKSTAVLKLAELPGVTISATTGKASERIGAKTVHSLLGFGNSGFTVKNLNTKLLIVDESSMLDWFTLRAILNAAPSVIFVGDPEQLPPVSGESVFKHLVEILPNVNLTKAYRQKNHILEEIETYSTNNTLNRIFTLYQNLCNSNRTVQIISPTVIGPLGTHAVNRFFIDKLHNSSLNGMKVLVTENITDEQGFYAANGLTGEIICKLPDSMYKVKLYSKDKIIYLKDKEFEPAYALTVHKCQGDEWDHTIVVIPEGLRKGFLDEKLINVAVTRAKIKTYVLRVKNKTTARTATI